MPAELISRINFEIKPMKVFSGRIRIGCDVNSLDLKSCIESLHDESVLESIKVNYDESEDLYSLNVPVEGYPMIKADKPVLFNEVGVRLNNEGKKEVFDISLNREKFSYIKKRGDDQDDDQEDEDEDDDDDDGSAEGGPGDDVPPKGFVVQHLAPDQIQQGYKYGSSIIPVTAALKEQITIPTYPGIDVIQFCNKAEIPPWYYRDEPIILLPHSNCSLRDQLGFNSLSQSMLKQDLLGIVRYIQKQGSIVKLAALVPTIVLTDKTKNDEYPSGRFDGEGDDKKRDFEQMNDDDLRKDYFGFTLVSLTFLGDEKIPRLFNLNGVYKSGDDGKESANSKFNRENFPTPEMVESMDKFVESMDLDAQISEKENDGEEIIENDYVELNDFDTLPLIPTKGIEIQTNYKEVSDVTRRILSQNSFKIHLTGKLIKTIYQLHLENSKEGDALFDLVEKNKDETIGGKPFFDDFIDKFVGGLVITDSNTGKSVFKEQLNIDEELVGHMKSLFNIERKVKEELGVSNDDKRQNENVEEKLPPVSELLKEFD